MSSTPRSEVTVKPLDVVAGLGHTAVLIELSGAHPAAATRVQDQADPRGAGGRRGGAGARQRAATLHLQGVKKRVDYTIPSDTAAAAAAKRKMMTIACNELMTCDYQL